VITPCTIPIFIMIITYVAFTGSTVHGALLFATYAIGKGIILAVVATSSSAFLKDFTKKWGRCVEVIAGIILFLAVAYIIWLEVNIPLQVNVKLFVTYTPAYYKFLKVIYKL